MKRSIFVFIFIIAAIMLNNNELRSQSGGNVGIGELNPVGKLHVSVPGEWAGVTFTGSGLNDLTVDYSGYSGTGAKSYMVRIQNAGPNPDIIEYSSNGGTTWSSPVAITSNMNIGYNVIINFGQADGHTYADLWSFTVNQSFMNTLVVVNDEVGIGTTGPTEKLDVNGNFRLRGHFLDYNNTSGTVGQVLTRGTSGLLWQNNISSQWTTSGSNIYYNTGNVGIGDANPTWALDLEKENNAFVYIKSTGTTSGGGILLDRPNLGSSTYLIFRTGGANKWRAGMFYDVADDFDFSRTNTPDGTLHLKGADGYAGFGTMSPTERLDVNGNFRLRGHLFDYSNGSGTAGQVLTRGASGVEWQTNLSSQWTTSGSNIYYNSGSVGIGNTSPTQSLHVTGNMRLTGLLYDNYNVSGSTGDVLTRGSSGTIWQSQWFKSGSNLYYTDGNIGIGTNSPNRPLKVMSNSLPNAYGIIHSEYTGTTAVDPYGLYCDVVCQDGYGIGARIDAGYSGVYIDMYHDTYASYTYGVRAINNGINTGAKYGVNASVDGDAGNCYAFYGSCTGEATTRYAGYFSGNVTVTGIFSNPSDIALKDNLAEIASPLQNLMDLNVYSFNYKDIEHMELPKGRNFGFVAQEMENLFPELVSIQKHPVDDKEDKLKSSEIEYKGINYIGMIPLLTKAIQEQQVIIESQRKEIDELMLRMSQLENEKSAADK